MTAIGKPEPETQNRAIALFRDELGYRYLGDCLKIWNPGELPENWSVENLLKQHSSRPFNPSVANAFFRAGEIEAWGRGVQRIFDACREAGTPAPSIRYQPGDLWLEFPFPPEYLAVIPAEVGGEKLDKMSGKMSGKIVRLMLEKPEITIPELAQRLKRTERTIERLINQLKADAVIRRIGPAKGGHWEVTP